MFTENPWLLKYYDILIKFCLNIFNKSFNLVINYPCELNVKLLINVLSKWILCKKKKRKYFCNICSNCYFFDKKIHPNFYFLNNDIKIDIDCIRNINLKLINNIYFGSYKIIFFNNYNFVNIYVNNYLLKLMEEFYFKVIFIFTCFSYIKIPNTLLSRSYRFFIFPPSEIYLLNFFKKKYFLNNISDKSIISIIRINYFSPLKTLFFLKNQFNKRLFFLNFMNNFIYKKEIKMIEILLDESIDNLFLLLTIFFDIIYFEFNNKYYYNLDSLFLFKNILNNLLLNDKIRIFYKIYLCINNINNIYFINKKILIYELVYYIYFLNK